MFNSVRLSYYVDKFFDLLDKFYKNEFRVIQSTYYLFNPDESVFDKDVLKYGAYERIGDLSGYRWIKILYFPVAYSTETHPMTQPTQYGVIKKTETVCVFPRICFDPTMLDFVVFNLRLKPISNVYQVTQIEEAYISKTDTCPIYKVTLKEQPFTVEQINNQVTNTYAYSEVSDSIYRVQDYNTIINATTLLNDISLQICKTREASSGLIPHIEV